MDKDKNDEHRKESEPLGSYLRGIMRSCSIVISVAIGLLFLYGLLSLVAGLCGYVDLHGDKERISSFLFAINQVGNAISMIITAALIIGLLGVVFAARRSKLHPEAIEESLYGVVLRAIGDYFSHREKAELKVSTEESATETSVAETPESPIIGTVEPVQETFMPPTFGVAVVIGMSNLTAGPELVSLEDSDAEELPAEEPIMEEVPAEEPIAEESAVEELQTAGSATEESTETLTETEEISELEVVETAVELLESTDAGLELTEEDSNYSTLESAETTEAETAKPEEFGQPEATEANESEPEPEKVSEPDDGPESDTTEPEKSGEPEQSVKVKGFRGFLQKALAKIGVRLEFQPDDEPSGGNSWAEIAAKREKERRSELFLSGVFTRHEENNALKEALAEMEFIDLEEEGSLAPDAEGEILEDEAEASEDYEEGLNAEEVAITEAIEAFEAEEAGDSTGNTQEIAEQVSKALAESAQAMRNPVTELMQSYEKGISEVITGCVETDSEASTTSEPARPATVKPGSTRADLTEALEEAGFDSYYDDDEPGVEQLLSMARDLGLNERGLKELSEALHRNEGNAPVVKLNNSQTSLEAICQADGAMLTPMQGVPIIHYPNYAVFKLADVLKMDSREQKFTALAEKFGLLSDELEDALETVNLSIEDIQSPAEIKALWGVVCFSIDRCGLRGDADPLACITKEREDEICSFLAQDIASNLSQQASRAQTKEPDREELRQAVGQSGQKITRFPKGKVGGTTGPMDLKRIQDARKNMRPR